MKPVIYKINAFDKSDGYTVKISYGGNQVFKNKLVIYKNVGSVTTKVYEQIQSNANSYVHYIAANTLENISSADADFTYTAKCTVFDLNDVESDESSLVSFRCYKNPTFEITNLDDTVRNSSYDVGINYSQEAGEQLDDFRFELQDMNGQVLLKSPKMFDLDSVFTLTSLKDNSSYKLNAFGVTVYGTELQCSATFDVIYSTKNKALKLNAENVKDMGCIKLQTSIRSNIAELDVEPAKYENDTWIDLRENGVSYFDGVYIEDSNAIQFYLKSPLPNNTIYRMTDGTNGITLRYMELYDYGSDLSLVDGEFVNSSVVKILYPSDLLYPSDTLYMEQVLSGSGIVISKKAYFLLTDGDFVLRSQMFDVTNKKDEDKHFKVTIRSNSGLYNLLAEVIE